LFCAVIKVVTNKQKNAKYLEKVIKYIFLIR